MTGPETPDHSADQETTARDEQVASPDTPESAEQPSEQPAEQPAEQPVAARPEPP
ncbi:MAG: hypothetical protein HOQ45_23570, partial [Nocardioidaceae bacterium]|nr:hypothetical protein [Nocardioidaceae bacterium]